MIAFLLRRLFWMVLTVWVVFTISWLLAKAGSLAIWLMVMGAPGFICPGFI